MIKRIIFDIDGTLITGVDFSERIIDALKIYGVDDQEKAKLFFKNIKEYEKKYSLYDKETYLNFFSKKLQINLDNNFLNIFWDELKKAIPKNSNEIKDTLSKLKDYELVLLSNYFEESQRNRLKSMGINDFFTEYYGENIIKPNILAYKTAAGIHSPNDCLIVGDDKELDIDIPKSLNFKTIWINENGDIKSINELSRALVKKL